MTLAAFAAEHVRCVPAIARYLLQASTLSSKPAARRCRSTGQTVGRTDGRTDGRTPDRYVDPASCTMRAALIIVCFDSVRLYLQLYLLLFVICFAAKKCVYVKN